ncbi:MAG: PPOX class F420-dependent oxidoreductase [Candidatus Dormiibacterota bacterium]
MTTEEWRAFVSRGTRTAKVAVARRDGQPIVTPVWFALDGDDIVFTTSASSLKASALRRDPRLALCVDDDRPPFSFVSIQGAVTLSDDLAEVRRVATVVGGRYMGAEQAEAFGVRNGVPGELAVRVRLAHVTALADIAD